MKKLYETIRPNHRCEKPRQKREKTCPGFSLVELLVVIAILSVLISILMPAIHGGLERAELAKCAANMRGIAMGIRAYTNEHEGKYPTYGGHVSWDDQISGYDGRAALTDAEKNLLFLPRADFNIESLDLCGSFENPETVEWQGTTGVPRSYAINYYRPTNGYGGVNWALGVSGDGVSRHISETDDTSRSIILFEHLRARALLGSTSNSSLNGPVYRNWYSGGPPSWNTARGPHSGGTKANFAMADGRVESFDFVDTGFRTDGSWMYAGGDWRNTMWDAGIAR